MNGEWLLVVDLDGTLCDSAHREHHAQAGEWEQFHSLLKDDRPWRDVLEVVRTLESSGWYVLALTGRNEKHRIETFRWFNRHEITINGLEMRPDDNYDSDTVIKPKLLDQHLSKRPLLHTDRMVILEDRDKVVEAWRNLGYRCWQVQPGGY